MYSYSTAQFYSVQCTYQVFLFYHTLVIVYPCNPVILNIYNTVLFTLVHLKTCTFNLVLLYFCTAILFSCTLTLLYYFMLYSCTPVHLHSFTTSCCTLVLLYSYLTVVLYSINCTHSLLYSIICTHVLLYMCEPLLLYSIFKPKNGPYCDINAFIYKL